MDPRRVRRVGHDQEVLVAQPVHDEVVEDPAVRRADQRVPGPAGRQPGQVAGQRVVQRGGRVRAGHRDLAHVRQVEQPGRGAHGVVLGGLAGVPQRHQPAREISQCRTQPLVHGG